MELWFQESEVLHLPHRWRHSECVVTRHPELGVGGTVVSGTCAGKIRSLTPRAEMTQSVGEAKSGRVEACMLGVRARSLRDGVRASSWWLSSNVMQDLLWEWP